MKDLTASEQFGEIHELRMTTIALHGFLNEDEKSFDKVKLTLDRIEPQMKRLPQQIRELQGTVFVLQDAEEQKHPELAANEVSGQTFTSVFNRNRVSEAKSAGRFFVKPHDFATSVGRNFVNPFSRDTLESPVVNNTSVHVEQAKPFLRASTSSFSQVSVATPLVPPTAASPQGNVPKTS